MAEGIATHRLKFYKFNKVLAGFVCIDRLLCMKFVFLNSKQTKVGMTIYRIFLPNILFFGVFSVVFQLFLPLPSLRYISYKQKRVLDFPKNLSEMPQCTVF